MHVWAQGNRHCPAPEKTFEESSSKKSKLSAEQSAVASLIKEPKPSVKNTAECSGPENTSLLERKIEQLKKQLRPFDVYTTGPDNQLLLSDKPSMIDASVISYDSKGPVQHLNCRAFNRDDYPIKCTNLAYTFAIGGFGCKTNVTKSETKEPGGKFNTVASVRKLEKNTAIKTDRQLKKTPVRWGTPKVAVYLDADHFGQALYDVWMDKGDQASHDGKSSQTWLFSTENHLIAIRLMPTTGSSIKIEWYDPNYTTIVRRVMVSNEETLQQLTLNQFVSMPEQEHYAIGKGRAAVLKSTDAVEPENNSDVTVLAALTPSLLYMLMRHGQLSSFMDSLKMTLSGVRRDNSRELIELLAAKSKFGMPGLYIALHNGHQEAISTYVEVIKQLRDAIEPEVIRNLLAAKRENGTPGLYVARIHGQKNAIRTYVEGVKQFGGIIEPKAIKELLAGKREKPESSSSRPRNQPEKTSDLDLLCTIL